MSYTAHTVNLMVGDIAKIKPIQNTILMVRNVTVYIYSHTITLNMMRDFMSGEIYIPGATRFATTFLPLHQENPVMPCFPKYTETARDESR